MKYIMMGVSSNFGTMFSVAGASLFLSFLPMTAIQILLNNLLYDLSEATIPTDNVDEEYIEKPKKLDISYIRRFMVTMGPVSSIFDFLTFFLLLLVFKAAVPVFQTAWFVESLINTSTRGFRVENQKNTVLQEQAGQIFGDKQLNCRGGCVRIALHAAWRHIWFSPPPATFYLALVGLIAGYLFLVEVVKKWFLKRYAYLLEQVYVPKKAKMAKKKPVNWLNHINTNISFVKTVLKKHFSN